MANLIAKNKLVTSFLRATLFVLTILISHAVYAVPDLAYKIYDVTFYITVNSAGKATSVKVKAIRDEATHAIVKIKLPKNFIEAATQYLMHSIYSPKHREYGAAITYYPLEPYKGNSVDSVSPVTHANKLTPCTEKSHKQTIELETYQLHFVTPAGWCMENDGGGISLTPTHPAFLASISMDWYQPLDKRSYKNFDKRIADEVGNLSNARRLRLGTLKAVEVRDLRYTASNYFTLDTYVGVPFYKNIGELYMMIFAYYGHDHEEQKRYLQVYQQLIRSIKITQTHH